MAIWDDLGNDPIKAMILAQAVQGFAGGLSKRNNPPSNAYVPQGGGGGGGQGGGGFDIGSMLRMQQMQAQQANMTADNALKQQQFEAAQVAAQRQQELDQKGYQQLSEKTGMPVELLMTLGPEATKAYASNLDPNVTSQIQDRTADNTRDDKRLALEQGRFSLDRTSASQKAAADEQRKRGLVALGGGMGLTPEQSIAMGDQLTQLVKSRQEPSNLGFGDQLIIPGPDGKPVVAATNADPTVANLKSGIAAAGNVNNAAGFDSMLSAATEERKALTADVNMLEEQANSAKEMADLATQFGFGPGTDLDAIALKGEALLKKLTTGGSLSAEDTATLGAYERAKKLNLDEGIRTAQKLAPVTEQELKAGVEAALGPNTTIPRIIIQSVQLQALHDRKKAKRDALDSYQANTLENARNGGPAYSPAGQRLFEMQWERENPFRVDPYINELKALSAKYPVGGKRGSGGGGGKPDPAGIR